MKLIRFFKKLLLGSEVKWRRIKFGPAKGMLMPINRASNFREELGIFEAPLKKHIYNLAKNAKVAYDLGSERGYYALAFARLMKPGSKVYAFEPNEMWLKQLHEIRERNGLHDRIEIIGKYVTNRIGVEEQILPLTGETLKKIVDKISLDNFVYAEGNLPPDLIKIDIEGEELNALEGASKVISQYKPQIILEAHSQTLAEECSSFLAKRGYEVKKIGKGLWWEKIFPESRWDGFNPYNEWFIAQIKNEQPI